MYYTLDGTENGVKGYAWAKKLTRIDARWKKPTDNTIQNLDIFGTDTVVFDDHYIKNRDVVKQHVPRLDSTKEEHCNAQRYIRELTITEKLIYRIIMMKEKRRQKQYDKYGTFQDIPYT